MKHPALVIVATLYCTSSIAQAPYERWFQGIIYGSSGRVYPDNSAIITGQFYPSYTFLVKTDDIGAPLMTRQPVITGRYTALMNSLFTPEDELVLSNGNSSAYPHFINEGVITKWTSGLDTAWAYTYHDTAFDYAMTTSAGVFTADADGYAVSYHFGDSLPPQANAGAVLFLDTSGTLQWGRYLPSTLSLTHLVRANDGGFLGVATANFTDHIYFKTDDQFNLDWCRKLTAPFELRSDQIVQGDDDVIHYFVGIRDTNEVINFGYVTYSRSMAWLNIDPATGALLSTREIDFKWPTLTSQLQRTSDGHFLAGGRYTNNSLLYGVLRRWEGFVLKLNADGDMIWADSLAMPNYRNRIISMDEHNERLLLYTERYDDINPFHQYYVVDTSATPICGLERTDFHPLGTLPVTDAAYVLPAFTSVMPVRKAITWTIGNTPMTSLHVCGGIATDVAEEAGRALSIFPNPAGDLLNIVIRDRFAEGTILVLDASGRVVMRGPDATTLDLSSLDAGTYVIERDVRGERIFARFVKE